MTTYSAEQLAQMSDDELRRVIAYLSGWSVEYRSVPVIKENFFERNPEMRTIGRWLSPDGRAGEWLNDANVPNWPTDANAALELVESADPFELVHSPGGPWRACCDYNYEAQSERKARAICEAWALWKQSGGG